MAQACVFDVYGTLFDVYSVSNQASAFLGDHADEVARLWRKKQLEYSWLQALMGGPTDFGVITRQAMYFALNQYGLPLDLAEEKLMPLYKHLAPYPEVKQALDKLKNNGVPCLILTNGTEDMVRPLLTNAGLDDCFMRILSAKRVNSFKPHPSVYRLCVDALGKPASEIIFVSANGWDIAGAVNFGLKAVWVNRNEQPEEFLPGSPSLVIDSLAELFF